MTGDAATLRGATGQFATTRWSLVLSAGNDPDRRAADALSELCQLYWRPIFAFICRTGYSTSDAQDLTQDFFLLILRGSLLDRADPARGRFRSLLKKSLQNFLRDAHEKRVARKRGGDFQFVRWDEWMTESPSRLQVAAEATISWSPARLFDARWAATVAEQAMARLAAECEEKKHRRIFDVLRPCLTAESADISYEEYSRSLGVATSTVKRLVHQLRLRHRKLLRDEIAQTVEHEADIDDEVRHLCAALVASSCS